jgi:cytochrome b6-f complex iron-sulfur subunit
MTRRDLIQKVFVGGALVLVTPAILTDCKKIETNDPGTGGGNKITVDLNLAENSSLNLDGGSLLKQGVIIANTGGGNLVALSSICTHQGCTVGYSAGSNNFPCPCHGSVFSTSGSVVTGPASTALKSYPVTKVGNIITVTL